MIGTSGLQAAGDSPLKDEYLINGSYPFVRPGLADGLRSVRDPNGTGEE
ncbi:hypothetical protein OG948_57400 (plasmid) [Embleya sp. NBC_00888]|nr:hypothetical protein OG948_57400 [Embleya sp. NBC_00888]